MRKFKVVLALILCAAFAINTCAFSEEYTPQTSLKDFIYSIFNMTEIINTKYTGTPSETVWNGEPVDISEFPALTKTNGKDFVILNITDNHFSDYGYRWFLNPLAEKTIKAIVNEVKPDLITVTGDFVCDKSTVYSIKRVTDMFESFGIPWAPVFGNHDDEGNCDLNYLCEAMQKGPHCLLEKGDPEMGYGNYGIRILNEDGSLNEVVVMLDSHHSQANEKQQDWVSAIAKAAGDAEVSLFFHIPLPEYQYAYDETFDGRKWKDEYKGYGECNEKICCERDADGNPVQRGFFEKIKESGNIKYVICGHEHRNDFSVEYQGIRLTYTMKVGFASGIEPGFNGGTVITVDNGITQIKHLVKSIKGFREELVVNTKA